MSQYYSQEPATAAEQSTGFMGWVRSLNGMSVLVGAGIGIIVGLFLGWTVWPVKWTDAWPGDLTQEAKSHYLAAVAQVYSYYPDDRAAETARTRLFDLNDNIGEEIAAAQTYFDENPVRESSVYMTVLSELAAGLGASPAAPVIGGDAGSEPAAEGQTASAEVVSDGTSWFTWLLTLLVMILLIGGGIYIVARIATNRRDRSAPQDQYAAAQPASRDDDTSSSAATAGGAYGMPPPDDYRFDQEPDETIVYTTGTAVVEGQQYDDDAFFGDESAAGYAQTGQEDAGIYARPSTQPQVAAPVAYQDTVALEETEVAVEAPPRSQQGDVLGAYEVHYQAGEPEFERSHNIVDPESGRYIGECGMGVNMKNGILQDIPENVIALDVWLFDQKQDKTMGSTSRVLLSEYAIDHALEQVFVREKPDGPSPVVAQPGVGFQLIGNNLTVDCEILEADYMGTGKEAGIFQNLRVAMTVRSRT